MSRVKDYFDKRIDIVFLILFVVFGVMGIVLLNGDSTSSDKVPEIRLRLNGVTLDDINKGDKDTKYYSNSMVYNGEDGKKLTFSNVELKGRGNSTWQLDKKSYRIKLDKKAELIAGIKSKKWILLSGGLDDSLLRNDLAFFLSRMIDYNSAPMGKFVNLNIDDEELGLYYLSTPVEIEKLPIRMGNEMGILVEMDNMHCLQEDMYILSETGYCFTVKDSISKLMEGDALAAFVDEYDKVEKYVSMGNYDALSELIDIDSFVKYFIISELSANPDAYVTSFYMYKDGDDSKIFAGPVWDFDGAFGNRKWGEMPEEFYDPWNNMSRREHAFGWIYRDPGSGETSYIEPDTRISRLFYHLIEMPEFFAEVEKCYRNYLLGKSDKVTEYINSVSNDINELGKWNAEKWKLEDFNDSVWEITWWVEQRMKFLESRFGIVNSSTEQLLQ